MDLHFENAPLELLDPSFRKANQRKVILQINIGGIIISTQKSLKELGLRMNKKNYSQHTECMATNGQKSQNYSPGELIIASKITFIPLSEEL